MEALGASVATLVTDACQVLVEQATATGVEAALAKGRSADHKSALAKAEKVQGNTQRALDQALDLAAKRGEESEAMRGALREAEDGRRKAEVEAAQLRVEVEAQRRRGDDLQQRLGVAEAQVPSLTSTLSATFTAQQGLGPQGVQSQGSGSRSGSQCVPFVNRPFESEIHGTVNFTQFCCVLLVTWCYRVLLSCYLRPE